VGPIERWAGPGIPDLVVLTREGGLLFDSYRGDNYVGPGSVLEEVEPLLNAMDGDSPSCRRTLHRLSVLQYVRAAAGGRKPPKPYLMGLDRSHYQTLEITNLNALLTIDARGRVTDARIEPQLPAALDFQLTQDVENWLFLPAVADGHAVATRVRLPIRF
jgi:hypothetical protein